MKAGRGQRPALTTNEERTTTMANRNTRVTGKHRKTRCRQLRRWLREVLVPVGFLVCAMLIIAQALAGAVARADAGVAYGQRNAHAICSTLDIEPTVKGVEDTLSRVIRATGMSPFEAGEAVGVAVSEQCRYHQPLIRSFVRVHGSNGRAA